MERLLPESVRFASRYKGVLGSSEISDLAIAEFVDEAVFCVMEALNAVPVVQSAFLDELARQAWMDSDDAVQRVVRAIVSSLPDYCAVPARPLIEMSWYGFVPRRQYELCAAELWSDYTIPVLAGYPATGGLVPLIQRGTLFYVILPEWLDRESTICGYRFSPAPDGPHIDFVQKEHVWEQRLGIIYLPSKFDLGMERVRAFLDGRILGADIIMAPITG